jgi:hypothetical protein
MATKKTRGTQTPTSRKPSVHGELRSGPIAGTALIDGATFSQKPVLYANVDGQAIFEGDIVLGTVQEMQKASSAAPSIAMRSIGITGSQFRWPNATVPYEIDSGLPNQQRVTDAIAHWQSKTSIKFVQRTAANQAQFPDFVRFVSGSGCSSMVGRQGGQQNVTLGSGCTAGNAIHEIGHTIGLWHEQSREDRDSFVTIVWANIDPSMQFNFSQHIQDGDDLGAYDYGSIMHYPRDAFSTNGQDTIVPKQSLPSGVVMGQRTALSAGDLAGVQALYPGATTFKEVPKDPIIDTTIKETSKEPTADTVKEVRKDPITDTVKEVTKEPTADTVKEVRKDPITDTVKEVTKEPTRDTVKELTKEPTRDTLKEVRKEPVTDTIKEAALDPGPVVGPVQPGPLMPGPAHISPFVLSMPSRAGFGGAGDPVAEATQQVQQIEEAIVQAEHQLAQLMQAYDQAVQALQALQGGQGLG